MRRGVRKWAPWPGPASSHTRQLGGSRDVRFTRLHLKLMCLVVEGRRSHATRRSWPNLQGRSADVIRRRPTFGRARGQATGEQPERPCRHPLCATHARRTAPGTGSSERPANRPTVAMPVQRARPPFVVLRPRADTTTHRSSSRQGPHSPQAIVSSAARAGVVAESAVHRPSRLPAGADLDNRTRSARVHVECRGATPCIPLSCASDSPSTRRCSGKDVHHAGSHSFSASSTRAATLMLRSKPEESFGVATCNQVDVRACEADGVQCGIDAGAAGLALHDGPVDADQDMLGTQHVDDESRPRGSKPMVSM